MVFYHFCLFYFEVSYLCRVSSLAFPTMDRYSLVIKAKEYDVKMPLFCLFVGVSNFEVCGSGSSALLYQQIQEAHDR